MCWRGGGGFKGYGEAVSRFLFLESQHSCEISYNCKSVGSYLLHNSPSLLPVQGHIKTDHLLTPYFVRPVLIIFPHLFPRFTRLSLFFPIFTKICIHFLYLSVSNATVLAIILLSYLGSCLALCFYLLLQFFNAGLEESESIVPSVFI
jgi:hypothetical protein